MALMLMNGGGVALDGAGLQNAYVAKSSHLYWENTYGTTTHSQTAHALNLT